MKLTQAVIYSFILIINILFLYENANAQMTEEYPTKFSLSGVIEISYNDYFYKLPSTGTKSEWDISFIQQTYGLGASGYILHPRLAVFNVGVSYTDDRQLVAVRGLKTNSHDFGYRIALTFLPYRPISLDLYGGNISDTVSEAPFGNQDRTTTYYGARLKIMKPSLPFMRLEYQHEEDGQFGWGRTPDTIRSDEYTLDFRGHLNIRNSVYTGIIQYVDFSGRDFRYKNKNVRLNIYSILRNGVYLQNSFAYSDIDFSKLLSLYSQLAINPGRNLTQNYGYSFTSSKNISIGIPEQGIPTRENTETIHSIMGSWTYRFVSGLTGSLALNYGLRNENESGISQDANFYGISASLSYSKSFLGMNFTPAYRFIFRKDDLKGDLLENNLDLSLVTRNFKWGTLYSDYSFMMSNENDKQRLLQEVTDTGATFVTNVTKIDSVINTLRTGIRGRGIGTRLSRAQWNMEAEIFYSRTKIVRHIPNLFSDEISDVPVSQTQTIRQNINRYSLLGNVSYPIGWATVFFSTGYSMGQSNSRSLERFFYEERINYPVLRNLRLLVRWKELWDKVAESPTQRVDEYSISAEYRIGQTTIGMDGTVLRTVIDNQNIFVRRFFIRLRRVIF